MCLYGVACLCCVCVLCVFFQFVWGVVRVCVRARVRVEHYLRTRVKDGLMVRVENDMVRMSVR